MTRTCAALPVSHGVSAVQEHHAGEQPSGESGRAHTGWRLGVWASSLMKTEVFIETSLSFVSRGTYGQGSRILLFKIIRMRYSVHL